VCSDSGKIRIAVSPEGGQIGVYEPGRVAVLAIPDLAPISEIGTEGDLEDNDVAFIGKRLVVLSRSARQSRLHVIDAAGPSKLGEASFRMPLWIAAVAGDYMLATGGGQTAIIDLSKPEVVATMLPVRGAIGAAGPMGTTGFVIASGDALEEWDAATRKPVRRVRLGRSLDPAFVGGDADRVWMISRQAPRHVEIIALTRRSSHTIELVTEPHRVAANPRGDLLAVICDDTHSTYVVDVARRVPPMRIDRGPMAAVAWSGAHTLVLQPMGQPLELLSIPGPAEPARAAPDDQPDASAAAPAPATERPLRRVPADRADAPPQWTRDEISQRLAAWRERVSARSAPSADPEPPPAPAWAPAPLHRPREASEPAAALPEHGALQPPPPGGWRSEIASWARSICARSYRPAPAHGHAALDDLLARLALDAELRDALALLYGAYLNGLAGVAPIDLAAVVHWDWDQAIGDGPLTRSGIVRWSSGRFALIPDAIAALDGSPPRTGTIIGLDGAAGPAGAIVAPSDVDVLQLGAWAAPVVGALLVPNRRGERAPHRFLLEARLRGLVPLVPWPRFQGALKVPPRTAAVLVDHAAAAAGLDLPVVATWSTAPQTLD
jgi:hypothetical protein